MQDWLEEKTVGDWRVYHFEVTPDECKLANLQLMFSGQGGRRVLPGMYTKLTHAQRGVVMSDTPAEMSDMWELYRMLKKYADIPNPRIHIDGLGMGICAKRALELGYWVEVVEIDPDVIQLIKPQLEALGLPGELVVIQADALTWKPIPNTRYTLAWHDIWDTICEDNFVEYATLNRRYGQRVDKWQGAWAQETINYMKRRINW